MVPRPVIGDPLRRLPAAIIVLMMLTVGASLPARADFEAGVKAYEQGDYQTAINEWLLNAAEEHPRALFNLGQMYRLGKGVTPDLRIAEQYYRRAAEVGHVAAQANLATLYFNQTPPQMDEAMRYWLMAARAGNPRSQYLVGVQYFNGDHIERDPVRAYAWISLAAQAGVTEAVEAMDVINQHLEPSQIADGKALSARLTGGRKRAAPVETAETRQASEATDTPSPEPDPAGTIYQAQFGSVENAAEAETLRDRLLERHQDVLAGATPLVIEPIGAPKTDGTTVETYRVKSSPLKTLEAANALCSAIQARDGVCLTVKSIPILAVAQQQSSPPDTAALPDTASQPTDLFRVQVAAHRSRAAAEAHWTMLNDRHGTILSPFDLYVQEADLGTKGIYFRVQAGPFETRNKANALCAELKAQSVECLVVERP